MRPRKHRKEMPCQQVVPGRTEYDVDRLLSHAATEIDDHLPGHFVPDRRPKQHLKLAPRAIGPSVTSPRVAVPSQPAQEVVAQCPTDESHGASGSFCPRDTRPLWGALGRTLPRARSRVRDETLVHGPPRYCYDLGCVPAATFVQGTRGQPARS